MVKKKRIRQLERRIENLETRICSLEKRDESKEVDLGQLPMLDWERTDPNRIEWWWIGRHKQWQKFDLSAKPPTDYVEH